MVDPPSFETPRERWHRRLNTSLPLGRIAGVDVRVLVLSLVIVPPILLLILAREGYSTGEVFAFAGLWTVLLYGVVLVHELGHVLAARHFGIPTTDIALTPLGGVAHLSAPPTSPGRDAVVSLAGPATHLLGLAVFFPLSKVVDPDLLRPEGFVVGIPAYAVRLLVQLNLWLLVFNLLPFYPLDGGRVLGAALSRRLHPNRARIVAARVGMVGAALFVVAAFVWGGLWVGILLAIAITMFLACRQEIRAARFEEGRWGGAPREPWESDPEAWKGGGRAIAVERPAVDRRTARQAERAAKEAADLDAALDAVLARLSEVGMDGLTRAERKVLDRAARQKRRE